MSYMYPLTRARAYTSDSRIWGVWGMAQGGGLPLNRWIRAHLGPIYTLLCTVCTLHAHDAYHGIPLYAHMYLHVHTMCTICTPNIHLIQGVTIHGTMEETVV